MAKGKAKINGSVSSAPVQPRSLRSRKRECPSDEISETDQATLHHQDIEGTNTAVDATLLQCHQESTMIEQDEAAGPSSLTKQDPDTEEKHADATHIVVKAFQEQEEPTVTNPNNDSKSEGFKVHADNNANDSGKDQEEMTAEECNKSQSQTDQLQVFLPISEEADEAALKEQLGAKENSRCYFEKKEEASQEEPSNLYMSDVKENTKEAAAGLPVKKKRRMGMCGLTERERSHFLHALKRENRQNGSEGVEKQNCNDTADLVAQEEIICSPPFSSSPSIPAGSVTEQDKAEITLQTSHYAGDDREETAATTSDGISAASAPGCSMGKSCEVETVIAPGPEQTGDTMSDPGPTEEVEELLGNQYQHEPEGSTATSVAEKPQEQIKNREDGSAAVDQSPAITFYSNSTQKEETENADASEAAHLQVNSVTRNSEKKGELTGDAGDGDGAEAGGPPTDTRSGGLSAVELCEAAATPSGSERKDSCDCDERGAGSSTENAEPPQTWDTTDPFGSGYLDYVTDSQLNTIVLSEVEGMEEDLGSPDHEDATNLICGLIRELSSLNRKVMATHRELENLRRGSKSSRSSIR